jgi:hypothetical protein
MVMFALCIFNFTNRLRNCEFEFLILTPLHILEGDWNNFLDSPLTRMDEMQTDIVPGNGTFLCLFIMINAV